MSDNKNGPLNDRGKGLEDEWIRRKEADEAKAKKSADAKKAGEKPAAPKTNQPQPGVRHGTSPLTVYLVVLGLAAAVAAAILLLS